MRRVQSALIDTVTVASIVVIVAAVLAGVAAFVISRARAARRKHQASLPRLVIPVSPEAGKGPGTSRAAAPSSFEPAGPSSVVATPVAALVVREEHAASDVGENGSRPRAPEAAENVLQFAPRDAGLSIGRRDGRDHAPAEATSGETVQFRRPTDEPLQLLPGRLEILQGENAGQDIRFVRVLGETPQIIFGREAGPSHRNVTLQSPTVSRRHACMEFSKGRWTITNLSHTNPVLINDEELAAAGESRALREGDRIELGEVVFRFRSR